MRFGHNPWLGGSYWHRVNAFELHFARSFQGHPTWPYLARSNTGPNRCTRTYYVAMRGLIWWQLLLYLISECMQYFAICLSYGHTNLCKYIFLKISNFHYMRILRMPLAFSSLWTWNWILVCSVIYWFMIIMHQWDISMYWCIDAITIKYIYLRSPGLTWS